VVLAELLVLDRVVLAVVEVCVECLLELEADPDGEEAVVVEAVTVAPVAVSLAVEADPVAVTEETGAVTEEIMVNWLE